MPVKSTEAELHQLFDSMPQEKAKSIEAWIDYQIAAAEIERLSPQKVLDFEKQSIKNFVSTQGLTFDRRIFEKLEKDDTISFFKMPNLEMIFASRSYLKFNSYPFFITMIKPFNELYEREDGIDAQIINEAVRICESGKVGEIQVSPHIVREIYMPHKFRGHYVHCLKYGAPIYKDDVIWGIAVTHETRRFQN